MGPEPDPSPAHQRHGSSPRSCGARGPTEPSRPSERQRARVLTEPSRSPDRRRARVLIEPSRPPGRRRAPGRPIAARVTDPMARCPDRRRADRWWSAPAGRQGATTSAGGGRATSPAGATTGVAAPGRGRRRTAAAAVACRSGDGRADPERRLGRPCGRGDRGSHRGCQERCRPTSGRLRRARRRGTSREVSPPVRCARGVAIAGSAATGRSSRSRRPGRRTPGRWGESEPAPSQPSLSSPLVRLGRPVARPNSHRWSVGHPDPIRWDPASVRGAAVGHPGAAS